MIQNSGTQLSTQDATVGTSGVAVRIFAMHIISGGVAGSVSLRNGTSDSATAYVTESGTVGTGTTFHYGTQGILFPAGCFIDLDANTTSVLVTFNYAS